MSERSVTLGSHGSDSGMREVPVVAEVLRSGVVESRHRGSLVVLGPDGAELRAVGAVDEPVFPRSSNKPLQATGMLEIGLDLAGPQLALAASSHSGEPVHVSTAREVLAGAGLDESALQTPPDWPLDDEALLAHARAGGGPERVLMNCSGKHAAMLATCVLNGWPLETYREPDHPLQVAIRATVERMAGEPVAAVGVDGCGAPVLALTLRGLARAFSALVTAPVGTPARRVADAMVAHPELVGGTHRHVTALMRAVPGLVAKDGAEGVYAAALPDGSAVALKIEDGADRPRHALLVQALRGLGAASPALDAVAATPVVHLGRSAGAVRVLL
ncbi:MAG: asparaginase [Motilibacteraceae bacterium]